jgi:hypothetical protein
LEATTLGEVLEEEVLVLILKPGYGWIGRYDKECLWSIHRVRGG